MTVKFITIKGQGEIARAPFYMGVVQHERTLSAQETYELCANHTGYKATAIKAVFMAVAEYIRENQRRGNITFIDGVASIRNYVKGAFQGLSGPWVKGVNYISVNAVEMDPFKTILAAVVPTNRTEGAKPVINTVLDETTLVYDVITGTDVFSIAPSRARTSRRTRRRTTSTWRSWTCMALRRRRRSTSATSRTSRRISPRRFRRATTRSRSIRAAASATSSACMWRRGRW